MICNLSIVSQTIFSRLGFNESADSFDYKDNNNNNRLMEFFNFYLFKFGYGYVTFSYKDEQEPTIPHKID